MEKNKIETYLGFCIRARKIIFGTEMISRQKKGVKLLMVDGGIGANSLKIMIRAQETFGCPLLQTAAGALGAWTHKPAVKGLAVTDDSLAQAILAAAQSDEQIKLYSGGNN